jgi:hypothetical protein
LSTAHDGISIILSNVLTKLNQDGDCVVVARANETDFKKLAKPNATSEQENLAVDFSNFSAAN